MLKAPLNAVLETDESGGDIREGTFRRILESVISISIYGKSDKTDDDEEALKELKESSRVELQCGQWNLTAVVEKDTASSNVSLGHSGKASAIAGECKYLVACFCHSSPLVGLQKGKGGRRRKETK